MLSVVTPAAQPILTLEELKLHLRVDHTDEDTLITALEKAAVGYVDGPAGILGRALITQTLSAQFQSFPKDGGALRLPCPPLQAVTEIAYEDADGVSQIMALTDFEVVGSDTRRGFVQPAAGKSWPTNVRCAEGAVQVTYEAGYGDNPADVPDAIKAALKLMVGHLYENREAVVTGTIATALPLAVDALLSNFKVYF